MKFRKMKKKEQNRKYEIERQIEKRKAEMEEDDEEWDPDLLGIFSKKKRLRSHDFMKKVYKLILFFIVR